MPEQGGGARVFDLLRARASVGRVISIRVRENLQTRTINGTVVEFGADFVVVTSDVAEEFISSAEVVGFSVPRNGEVPRPSGEADSPPLPLPDAPGQDVASPQSVDLPEGTERTEVAGRPATALIPSLAPDFARAKEGLGEDERAAYVHALNVWNYARKVNELSRLAPEVRLLADAAGITGNPTLMELAAEVALVCGLTDRAHELFARSTRLGSPTASYGAAHTAVQLGDVRAAQDHLEQFLLAAGAKHADNTWCALHAHLGLELVPDRARPQLSGSGSPPSGAASTGAVPARTGVTPATPESAASLSRIAKPVPAGSEAGSVPPEAKRSIGRVDRTWVPEQYGFILSGTPAGQRSIYFDFDNIGDQVLRKAVELGWRGTVTFLEVKEVSRTNATRHVAVDVVPQVPITLSAPAPLRRPAGATHSPGAARGGSGGSLRRAKRLELERDLDGAEAAYREVVAAGGQGVATAVKELAWLLNRKGQWRAAIEVLDEHGAVFGADMRPADNLRLHILLKGKQYLEMRAVIARLQRTSDPRQRLTLIRQDVYCLIALSRFEDAADAIVAGLHEYPDDSALLGMRDRLTNLASDPDEVDLVILQDIGAGVDDFALFYLENSTLAGADERVKARGDFVPSDFTAVNQYIDSIRGVRPRERADAMLTLAHMAWKVPYVAGEHELRDLLRRFFSLMAEAHAASSSDPDTVRTFAAEALAYCRPEQVRREVPVLLATYLPGFTSTRDDKWPAMAEAFAANPNSLRTFLTHLPHYEARSSQLRAVILSALVAAHPGLSLDLDFLEQRERDVRQEELRMRTLLGELDRPMATGPLELGLIEDSLSTHASDALFALDRRRLQELAEAVRDALTFFGHDDYLERRASYERARSVLMSFCDQVDEHATRISVVGLRPFAERLLARVQADQNAFLQTARAHLKVSDALENDHYQLEADSIIKIPLLVELAAGDPPIEDVTVTVDSTDGLRIEGPVDPIALLHAGQAREIRLPIAPTPAQVAEAAFTLTGQIHFTALDKQEACAFTLPIRLDTESDFKLIENPYESYSGGLIVADPAMFYGRGDVVERLVSQVTRGPLGQCYVLYGQKRSGKSSVLEQVKQRLVGSAIPVKLTMGELDTVQADYSFLRVCISELEEALKDRGLWGHVDWPDLNETRITLEVLKGVLRAVQRGLSSQGEVPRVVYLIDEFTYIYGYVKQGIVEQSFMRQWKALIESHLINTVVVGQDSMPRFMAAFPNEFGVTKDERLSYLSPDEARALASEPIHLDGGSRYRGRSLQRLLELTGCSPWFLQIMCDRLVRHLNRERAPLVTESDIDAVARGLVTGDGRLGLETFDPLITAAGDAEADFPHDAYLGVLQRVAWYSADRQGARPSAIVFNDDPDITTAITEDLIRRDVLLRTPQGNLRIRVALFESWLRSNRPVTQGSEA